MSAEILDGSGRFVLLNKPAAYPFKDIVTGVPEGPVFDLSVDFDGFDGVGYLKAEHVIEMAHTLGMSTKEETDSLRARINELEVENSLIPNNVEGLINGIGNLVTEWGRGVLASAPNSLDIQLPLDFQSTDNDDRQGKGEESADAEESSPDESGKSESIGESPFKNSKPSVNKRSNKLSAGSADGFGFDS